MLKLDNFARIKNDKFPYPNTNYINIYTKNCIAYWTVFFKVFGNVSINIYDKFPNVKSVLNNFSRVLRQFDLSLTV